jgi:hypothetical protein
MQQQGGNPGLPAEFPNSSTSPAQQRPPYTVPGIFLFTNPDFLKCKFLQDLSFYTRSWLVLLYGTLLHTRFVGSLGVDVII